MARAMRVAHVMAGAAHGGAELFFERLVTAQAQAGDAVLPLLRAEPARFARLRAAGLSPVTARFGSLDVFAGRGRREALERFAPRVAVAWMGRAASVLPRGTWVSVGRLGGRYDLRRFRRCDHLIANTAALADWVRGCGWPAARTHVLPNFVTDPVGTAAAALPVQPGAKIVLGLGRLHPNKGFDVLIAAAALLPAEIHVVIAGEGPLRRTLLAQARAAGIAARVHLIGWRQDTAALLAACDVLCCPSRVEPLGNVVLEAFAARRPVVAAAAEGPAAMIRPGHTGLVVPIGDAPALARALGTMLGAPEYARTLAAQARAVYETQHAEAPVLAQWRDFLSTVER